MASFTIGTTSARYSPDGCHIVTGSIDKTVRIWDAETGAAVGKPLQGHTTSVIPSLIPPMGNISFPDPLIAPFESGMLRLVLQLESLWRAMLGCAVCCLFS